MDREQIYYQSTRGEGGKVTASQAILQGLAPDGGLYVPDHLPKLDVPTAELAKMHYREVAFEVLKLFLTDYTEEELHSFGINKSSSHVDFMIGSKDLNIVGTTEDGREVAIFKDGNWAF